MADNWCIGVPDWHADERNQMSGPADDAGLTIKLPTQDHRGGG
jgi:hypothetical protein